MTERLAVGVEVFGFLACWCHGWLIAEDLPLGAGLLAVPRRGRRAAGSVWPRGRRVD